MEYRRLCKNKDCAAYFTTSERKKYFCSVKCKRHQNYLDRSAKEAEVTGKKIKRESSFLEIPTTCLNISCNEVINENYVKGRPQKYCSLKCKNSFNYKFKNVEIKEDEYAICVNPKCEAEFVKSDPRQVYCEKICGERHRRDLKKVDKVKPKLRKAYKPISKELPDITVCCHNCGIPFNAKRKSAMFCNPGCKNSFKNNLRRKDWVHFDKFYHSDLLGISDLVNNIFIDCEFISISFNNMNLTNTKFIRCTFNDCSFRSSMFYATEFFNCEYEDYGIEPMNIRMAINKFSKFDEGFFAAIGGRENMGKMIHMKTSITQFRNEKNSILMIKARER